MTDRRNNINLMFGIIVHCITNIIIQAILFSQEIWWYDISLRLFTINLLIMFAMIVLDFLIVKKLFSKHLFSALKSILVHFSDMLLLLPVLLMFLQFSKEFSIHDPRIIKLFTTTLIVDGLVLIERIVQHQKAIHIR